jgi:xanthine dehydrogenase accessory factor
VHNPCLSGGTLEIFLEPSVPPPLIVVVGETPIANALVSLGGALRYSVERYTGALPGDTAAVVVASHGRGEDEALSAALGADVGYIGLVASARRGRAVLDGLDLSDQQRARINTPAGLNLGAATAEEIGLSILAQIVATRSRLRARPAPSPGDVVPAAAHTDPVCGMTVWPDEHALHLRQDAETVWFCGRGCRDAFASDPDRYRRMTVP